MKIPAKNSLRKGLLAAALTSLFGSSVLAAPMGDVDEPIKLAINEWTGQHISTHIAGEILRKMGYDIEYVTAGNYPQFSALGEGELSATLEVWTNNSGEIYPKMKESGAIVDIGNWNSGVDNLVSMRLFGRTSPSSKSKNVCQPMNRRGARCPRSPARSRAGARTGPGARGA